MGPRAPLEAARGGRRSPGRRLRGAVVAVEPMERGTLGGLSGPIGPRWNWDPQRSKRLAYLGDGDLLVVKDDEPAAAWRCQGHVAVTGQPTRPAMSSAPTGSAVKIISRRLAVGSSSNSLCKGHNRITITFVETKRVKQIEV